MSCRCQRGVAPVVWFAIAGIVVLSSAPARAALDVRSVVTTGQSAPGTGATFLDFLSGERAYDLGPDGRVAFVGYLAPGPGVNTTNDEAVYVGSTGGGLQFVARKGTQAPGAPGGVNYGSFSQPHVNLAGQVAVVAQLSSGSGTSLGMWAGKPGSLSSVALPGTAAPGT